nr:hypothetical protein [Tanacetum cinerariifolium]
LEEEKARRRGKAYNWETATHGKIWYNEDVHDLRSVETEFPAIVFNDTLTSETSLSDSLAYLKLSLGSSIYRVWKLIDTPYQAMWDTMYWGFLRVRTTFDIFQNILLLYYEYGILMSPGYGVLGLESFVVIYPLAPLPTCPPVPSPRGAIVDQHALRVVIFGGIIYTRENMSNVRQWSFDSSKSWIRRIGFVYQSPLQPRQPNYKNRPFSPPYNSQQAFYQQPMYRPSYEPPSPSSQPNQGYSLLNRINFDMDIKNLFYTQDYYAYQGLGQDYYAGQGSSGNQEFYTGQGYSIGQGASHGSAPIEDDYPIEEVAEPVKATKVSKRRQKIVTTKNMESAKP